MDRDTKSKSDSKEGELFLAQVAKKRYKDVRTSESLPKVNRSKKEGKEIDKLEMMVRKVTFISNSQPILGLYRLYLG